MSCWPALAERAAPFKVINPSHEPLSETSYILALCKPPSNHSSSQLFVPQTIYTCHSTLIHCKADRHNGSIPEVGIRTVLGKDNTFNWLPALNNTLPLLLKQSPLPFWTLEKWVCPFPHPVYLQVSINHIRIRFPYFQKQSVTWKGWLFKRLSCWIS